MTDSSFDVIVIGAGPAGEVAAGRLADVGLEVAICEPHLIGGECSFYACMPSKALLRPAEALAEARRIPGAAEAVGGQLDVEAALERRDEVIHDLDDSGQLSWLEDKGIALVRGQGRLDGERRVRVGDDLLTARRAVVLAAGSGAAIPPIEGLREASPWTNRELTTAKAVPPRLAILGGGVVGCEMAQAWATLGSSVTLIERGERVLAKEEPFAADQVTDSLRAQGVEVRLATEATAVRRETRSGTGRAEVTIELEPGEPAVADELLVAAGRRPHTDDLGVETVGLEPGALVAVDDRLRATGVEGDWLYAIGDVNGRSLLTHMGKYQARAAVRNILGGDARASQDHLRSPRVTFTDPQVAAVGHTLASAEEAGLNARAVDMETSRNAGGSFYGRNAPGTTRIVVDRERSVIVGATFCGAEVVDFLHAATIAVVAEVPLETLFEAVPAFPTRSEVWLNLLEGCGL